MPSDQVMSEFSNGTLNSGSPTGPRVRNRKQAVAILLSEKRKESGLPDLRSTLRSPGIRPPRRSRKRY